jgi:hypothetical protein
MLEADTNTQRLRNGGRFFGRRVNCEYVPLLPAWAVAQVLDDPHKTPYFLVWKSRSLHSVDSVEEAVHVVPHSESGLVEIRRQDGTSNLIRAVSRPLPRNGGSARLLICPYCQIPRRGLYGWEPGGRCTTSVVRSNWKCRACNKLRYASEGGALVVRGRGVMMRIFGRSRSDRPEPWYPYVFASPEEAAQAGA